VHRWAAGYVGRQYPRWVDRASEEEILSGGPGDDSLISWFRAAHATLVRTLDSAAPDVTCWTFLDAPSPLAFWARRQAHETTIHRVDAQQAAAAGAAGLGAAGAGRAGEGTAGTETAGTGAAAAGNGAAGKGAAEADLGETGDETAIAPRLAADGIDELIMGFLGRDAKRGSWDGPPATFGFHADDGGTVVHWRVAAGPGRLAVSRETGPADCHVTGPAADLYLLLWNRRDADGLDVRGDAGVLADFRRRSQVTWR
jgi:MDMPI C-terminal domain/Mycothiol maleylpyruvate isomerase N-terminal domain